LTKSTSKKTSNTGFTDNTLHKTVHFW